MLIEWLLEGDVSIQYQTQRDLLNVEKVELRNRIAKEGWGEQFLSYRSPEGYWGRGFYQPKWTSTHYTVLDLKNLGISPKDEEIKQSVNLVLQTRKGPDGGINPSKTIKNSDVCINGMFLNYASYFRVNQNQLESIIDFLISLQIVLKCRPGCLWLLDTRILTFVPVMWLRCSLCAVIVYPPSGSVFRAAFIPLNLAPASISAPSVISPLIPAKQSKYNDFISLLALGFMRVSFSIPSFMVM